MSDAAFRNGLSYALGPLAFIKDAFDLGTYLGELLIGDTSESEDDIDHNRISGVASPRNVNKVSRSISKHGKQVHQQLIRKLVRRSIGNGGTFQHMRVNRKLIDPKTGQVISDLRPDVFSYDPTRNTVFIGEAVVTTSLKEAQDRLMRFRRMYQRLGYNVHSSPPETP
jgi:hypothetical protein